jgi:hypothetical protein
VTEAEWLACDDPRTMLAPLQGRASGRKLWLFVAACWRHAAHDSTRWARGVLAVLERHADEQAQGEAARPGRDRAGVAARTTMRLLDGTARFGPGAAGAAGEGSWPRALLAAVTSVFARGRGDARPVGESRRARAALLRCVAGNPFRPAAAIDPGWLAWNGGTVRKLAEGVYDERAFDRLPILADALEDAGCTDRELVGHLRGPGPHVRGCWAVDLLLGKE